MSNKVKDIDIKNRKTTFSVICKNVDPNNIKINGKSYKNIFTLLYWIYDNQILKICKSLYCR